MNDVIRVSAVSFLNTLPYLAGFEQIIDAQRYYIEVDTPSVCAEKLKNGSADLGLAPVVAREQLTAFRDITCWGIGCDGKVGSVLIVSQIPIAEVDTVYLDPQSKTSNELAKIVLEDHFQLFPEIRLTVGSSLEHVKPRSAWVVIGDKALAAHAKYGYVYDLGQLWKEMTGLPFVFARWVGSDKVTNAIEDELSEAFGRGMSDIPVLAKKHSSAFGYLHVHAYLSQQIKYDLRDTRFIEGEETFLNRLSLSETLTEN